MTEIIPSRPMLVQAVTESYKGPAWHGPSVMSTLGGVEAEAAAWRPGPGRNTVAELVRHLAYTRHRVAGRIVRQEGRSLPSFPRRMAKDWWPEGPPPDATDPWAEERKLLTSYQEIFLEVVGGAPDDVLTHVSAGTGRSLGREVLGVAFHDCYHAGQIRQIVRMWEES